MRSDKMPYITNGDLESLIKKKDGRANNPEKFSATKIGEHIPCGYSMSPIWDFDNIEKKHTLHRSEDWMEKFCTSLKEHATNVINFEKKKILTLTKKELKLNQDATACYIEEKDSQKGFLKIKTIENLETNSILQASAEVHHRVYVI